MYNQPDSDSDPDDSAEPAKSHNPRLRSQTIRLALASMLALGGLAIPIEFQPGQGTIVPKVAAAKDGEVKVMTLNQALGADLTSLLAAPAEDLNAALLEIIEGVAATNFPSRAQRQAELIARPLPDLIGLQEVWEISCVDLDGPAPGEGCSHPSIADAFVDHLAVTLDALSALGVDYEAVATVKNQDSTTATLTLDGNTIPLGGIPVEIDGFLVLLTSSDRDVILARADTVINPVPVNFSDETACLKSLDGCNYQAAAPVELVTPNGLLELDFRRGLVAVDATVRGKHYRFVNTHLETHEPAAGNPLSRFFQAAQAAELITTLELTTPPWLALIVVGDMNSSPEHEPVPGPLPLPPPFETGIVPPYTQFIEAGYTDVWALRPGAVRGFTCCQAVDLTNRRSTLSERIDMIFSLELPERVKQVRLVGDRVSDKTPPPGPRLWPSDHAGVVAELEFGEPGMGGDYRAVAAEF